MDIMVSDFWSENGMEVVMLIGLTLVFIFLMWLYGEKSIDAEKSTQYGTRC